ncbi:MAG: UDP-N-acetylglucosamine 2-epimerase (non-hydrolyzing) [Bacteroidetes bacterium]|nr:UDP-N-acetylglucosamine 2-epimerase (non-hydrolyzing) [Bacteroidota bacterium]
MKRKKIISIVGARPQFIKLAPLSEKLSDVHEELILHTGQHYDYNMSDSFFADLKIKKPTYNLNIGSGPHGAQMGKMLGEIEKVLQLENPDLLIVFGDTNSTLAGALAASKMNIPVVHVEAGLRSYNRSMPEEINRIVTDHVSSYLFAPTINAFNILESEGLKEKSYLVGDISVDALMRHLDMAKLRSGILKELNLEENSFYLLTLHRPYNVDNPEILRNILYTLSLLDSKVLFPVHPRTRLIMDKNQLLVGDQIQLIDPLGYLDFIFLQSKAKKILTDSGGIQKEAFILKKACITLRSETEWIETVEDGWNLLMKPESELDADKIMNFNPTKEQTDIFGSNNADKMVEIINGI